MLSMNSNPLEEFVRRSLDVRPRSPVDYAACCMLPPQHILLHSSTYAYTRLLHTTQQENF